MTTYEELLSVRCFFKKVWQVNGKVLKDVSLFIANHGHPTTSMEIEIVIRNLPAKKAQVQMASQLNSTKNLEKS